MQPYMMFFFFLFYSINLIYVFISIILWLNTKIILINFLANPTGKMSYILILNILIYISLLIF